MMDLTARAVPFADQEMRAIRRSHVEAWVKAMVAAGLAPSTIRTRFNNVRSVFRGAYRDRVIGSDPCEAIVLPRRRRIEAAMRIPPRSRLGRSWRRQTHGSPR
jgi:site-specific recombinase XerD